MLRISKLCSAFTSQRIIARNAGHSKWANIRHIKGAKDSEKALIFQKYSRTIRLILQEGGLPDPEFNTKLKNIIEEAKTKNMPMATITSTIKSYIKKSATQQAQLRQQFVEMKFMNKIFLIAEYYTENVANLKSNLNIVLRKEPKSAMATIKNFFDEHGIIQVSVPKTCVIKTASEFEDKLIEDAIECEAQEVGELDFETKSATIICDPQHIDRVKTLLLKLNYVLENSEHVFLPQNSIELSDEERKQYDSFIKRLSQIEGFEKVFDNLAIM